MPSEFPVIIRTRAHCEAHGWPLWSALMESAGVEKTTGSWRISGNGTVRDMPKCDANAATFYEGPNDLALLYEQRW